MWESILPLGTGKAQISRLQAGQLRNFSSILRRSERLFPSHDAPDCLWGPPSLLFRRHRDKKLTVDLYLVPRLRMGGTIPPSPTCLHGMHRANFYRYTLLRRVDFFGTYMFYCTILRCYVGWAFITELFLFWDCGYRNSALMGLFLMWVSEYILNFINFNTCSSWVLEACLWCCF
jgi:hypothetical protein